MMRTALLNLQNSPSEWSFFPGVCPGWDNHPRRSAGWVFYGAAPKKYGDWLKAACEFTLKKNPAEERFVFVNAWNEWAEGAHLEPDRHFGYAYLAETGRALLALSRHERASASPNFSSKPLSD
jgi:lipopolysaccharide biosynthesis protein